MSGDPHPVLVLAPDLFFATRITATARLVGAKIVESTASRLLEDCRAHAPRLVIMDLHAAGEPLALARALKADPQTRAIPIVGFYSHVDQALREAALGAGIERVMPRSSFTAQLSGILTEAPA